MSVSSPLWISEAAVVANMDIGDAITALKKALLAEARGEAKNMMKTHVAWDSSTLHAIGAVFPNEGFAGTKTWAHTPGGATPLLILLDRGSGCGRLNHYGGDARNRTHPHGWDDRERRAYQCDRSHCSESR